MSSLTLDMPNIDADIFAAIGETMMVGSIPVPGIFENRYRVIELPDDTVQGVTLTFQCQMSEVVAGLEENEIVEIVETGKQYRFMRRLPENGDESGKVTLDLGTIK